MKKLLSLVALSVLLFTEFANAQKGKWQLVETENKIAARSECSLVGLEDRLYLIGGDGSEKAVEEYDPISNRWTKKADAPSIIHHCQAVGLGNQIYVLNAFSTNDYPDQKTIENVYSYNVKDNSWRQLTEIPVARRRGGAGAAVHHNKLYVVGGITNGHRSGTNAMFDCYDPITNKWTVLPDAPHIRDHSTAVVVGDKLFAIGGRNTSIHKPNNFEAFFSKVVVDVDCYNFKTGKWSTIQNALPLGTGGGTAVNLDGKIYYIGGERATVKEPNGPKTDVFCLDPGNSDKWEKVDELNMARNGVGGAVINHKIYIAGGVVLPGKALTPPTYHQIDITLEVFMNRE